MIAALKKLCSTKTARAVVLIIILTSLTYANALTNSFVWDDFLLIVDNDFVHSWDNFPLLFSPQYITDISEILPSGQAASGSGEISYRPVNTLTFFLDYRVWGMNPFGFHLTNLILHIANGILLFFFIKKISHCPRIATFSALLFALHPVNSETVAVINFREDLLVVFFALIVFLFHLQRHQPAHTLKRYIGNALSFIAYTLALFSKETAVMIPVLLLLYDQSLRPEQTDTDIPCLERSIKYYTGYITLTLFFLAVWFFPMAGAPDSISDYFWGNTATRIFTMIAVIFQYLSWLILPIDVHATIFDPSVLVHSALDPRFLRSALLLLIIFASAPYLWKKSKFTFFFASWFFITLLPVMNILLMPNIYAARLLYLPAIGFCAIQGVLLVKIKTARLSFLQTTAVRKIITAVPSILLAFFMIFTFLHNFTWKDNLTLQLHMLRRYPDNPQIPVYLSSSLQGWDRIPGQR